ncbi:MAG: hypothetical protein KA028_02160, partial [Candidatus Pacebacteria bacterium]|nr:hypothetical protein [Candidatus Paceibacterota bacterium]
QHKQQAQQQTRAPASHNVTGCAQCLPWIHARQRGHYHGEKGTAMIRQMAGNTAEVILVSSPGPVVSGQSFVVYDKNVCVGGGVIS